MIDAGPEPKVIILERASAREASHDAPSTSNPARGSAETAL